MSQSQTLRDLVNERLTAAADEIFALFERTIAGYEEELCLYKEENQRKQELLDSLQVALGGTQIVSLCPDPCLNQRIQDTPHVQDGPHIKDDLPLQDGPQIKVEPDSEEQSIKLESEPVLSICETGETSLCPQTELRVKQREDTSAGSHSETDGHFSDEDLDCSASPGLIQTEAYGHYGHYEQQHYNTVQHTSRNTSALNSELFYKYRSAAEMNVDNGDMPVNNQAPKSSHHCPVCNKTFKKSKYLRAHIRLHTGEKPYCCSICAKSFTQKGSLNSHKRTHLGEKPFSCPICKKKFTRKSNLKFHERAHY